MNAIFCVAVNACSWRGLPAEYGRWHTASSASDASTRYDETNLVFSALVTVAFIADELR